MTLSSVEAEAVLRRLEPNVPQGLVGQLVEGTLEAYVEGQAAIITTPATWKAVVVANGPAADLQAALTRLTATAEALVWDEGAINLPADDLERLGFHRVQRELFVQEIRRSPLPKPPPPGIEYALCDARYRAAARRLFGHTHALSLEGLYVTIPRTPSAAACEKVFEAHLTSDQLVAETAVVAVQGSDVVGVVYCLKPTEGHAGMLTGLAVDPRARGLGLSRGLGRRAQQALLRAGYEQMGFLTTDQNVRVHQLFVPEELVHTEVYKAWFARR